MSIRSDRFLYFTVRTPQVRLVLIAFINYTRKPPVEAELVVTYLQFPSHLCCPCGASPCCARRQECRWVTVWRCTDRHSPTLLPLPTLVVLIIVYIFYLLTCLRQIHSTCKCRGGKCIEVGGRNRDLLSFLAEYHSQFNARWPRVRAETTWAAAVARGFKFVSLSGQRIGLIEWRGIAPLSSI